MKTQALQTYLSSLKTAQLVAIYNLATPKAPVKKFENRGTAEKRLLTLLTGWNVTKDEPDGYANFFADFAVAGKLGFDLPEPEAPAAEKPEPGEKPKREKKERAPREKKEKEAPSPHLNLRCGTCKFYAKTTEAMMKLGRLACPVDPKHGKLLTAVERSENRGIAAGGGKK